jgi:hypothetical protein
MATILELDCAACGRTHGPQELVCSMCGHLLKREKRARAPYVPETAFRSPEPEAAAPRAPRGGALEPWLYLGIGIATAPVFALTPVLGYMAWFLASLVHEMGHAGLAWLCGMPAVPAIALDGHAAAMHGEPMAPLALTIWATLVAGTWRLLEGRARIVATALVALGHPLLAFTGLREVVHLLAGHGAELAFAALALWKALDGGFTRSRVERALYSTVGWMLLGRNASLCLGLIRSEAAREEYRGNGSFGLTNDYLRVSEEILGWPVERVAASMLLAALLVLPAALLAWRVSKRWRAT